MSWTLTVNEQVLPNMFDKSIEIFDGSSAKYRQNTIDQHTFQDLEPASWSLQ